MMNQNATIQSARDGKLAIKTIDKMIESKLKTVTSLKECVQLLKQRWPGMHVENHGFNIRVCVKDHKWNIFKRVCGHMFNEADAKWNPHWFQVGAWYEVFLNVPLPSSNGKMKTYNISQDMVFDHPDGERTISTKWVETIQAYTMEEAERLVAKANQDHHDRDLWGEHFSHYGPATIELVADSREAILLN